MKVDLKFFLGFAFGLSFGNALFYILILLQLGAKTETSRWPAEIIEKKLKAANAMKGPKLVIVGGSASHFGVSASEIERATGYPCVNGASFGGLGPVYILETGKRMLKPGDSALLVLEYELLVNNAGGKPYAYETLCDFVFARDPNYFQSLPAFDQFRMMSHVSGNRLFSGLRYRNHEAARNNKPTLYDVKWVNSHGDQTGHTLAMASTNRGDATTPNSIISKGTLNPYDSYPDVEAFCAWAHARQIRVIATFPNVANNGYTPAMFDALSKTIRTIFARYNVEVISSAADASYPPEKFLDTNYHLTYETAITRSQDLAKLLKPILKRP